jgi:hypothetical protein
MASQTARELPSAYILLVYTITIHGGSCTGRTRVCRGECNVLTLGFSRVCLPLQTSTEHQTRQTGNSVVHNTFLNTCLFVAPQLESLFYPVGVIITIYIHRLFAKTGLAFRHGLAPNGGKSFIMCRQTLARRMRMPMPNN